MKIWVDDLREAPAGYVWCKSTNDALRTITKYKAEIELIDLDHDAGDFALEGGDFVKVLRELERLSHRSLRNGDLEWDTLCKNFKFRLHSANPVGVQNMRAILQYNNWVEVY